MRRIIGESIRSGHLAATAAALFIGLAYGMLLMTVASPMASTTISITLGGVFMAVGIWSAITALVKLAKHL